MQITLVGTSYTTTTKKKKKNQICSLLQTIEFEPLKFLLPMQFEIKSLGPTLKMKNKIK